jgi:hypothetical protein
MKAATNQIGAGIGIVDHKIGDFTDPNEGVENRPARRFGARATTT